MSDEHTIPLGRFKIVLSFLGAVAFVAVGVWMFTLNDQSLSPRYNPLFVRGVAALAIGLFGFFGVAWLWKLFDRRPGLQFSSAGITDTSSGIPTGFIPWSDIAGYDTMTIKRNRLLVLQVKNPEHYVARGNWMQQRLKQANLGICGSPVVLASAPLSVGFDEMLTVFETYWAKYGKDQHC